MHNGFVVEVKELRPHSNADKLQLATFYGETAIVDLSVKIGDIGVYFPCDLQLSEEFCEKNNLVRKKDESGNNIGGFLDPDKRNIKALKLRGEKSYGLYLPLSAFEYTGVKLSSLTVGSQITILNGHEICTKYIPHSNKRAYSGGKINKTRKHITPIAPLLKEHADTEQLAYNLADFKPGDEVEITLKMHGCFIKDTKVRMADNSLKAIQCIKEGDMVLGYDIDKNKIIPTKVVHTFKNAPSTKWNRIKFSRDDMRGDKRGTQTSTYNHKYWVKERNEWVMAKDLKVGETISTLFPSPVLTSLQKQIAIGQFLGDGCLMSFSNRTAEIQESKEELSKKYLEYISELTSNWFYIYQEKVSDYNSNMIVGRTARSADLYNYMLDSSTFINKPDHPRLLPGIIDKVTPISLAIWYMGDGSLLHSESQQDRALLAICRYDTLEDREIIVKIFNKFNIYPTLYQDSKNYWRIRFNLQEANKLFDLISPYIIEDMRYKLPKNYSNNFIFTKDEEEYNPNGWVMSPQVVLENTAIEETYDEYDLETELHNYIVGLSVVHNTSQRTAHLPTLQGYADSWPCRVNNILRHIMKKMGCYNDEDVHDGEPIYDWGYVSGTRRVVLENYEGGFYGDNSFREPHSKIFEGKLWKGETVYYEVVGFTTSGAPIMSSASNSKLSDKEFVKQYGKETVFSYGCSPTGPQSAYDGLGNEIVRFSTVPQSDIYVYRMTMTNPDGEVVEYTPDFMRHRCGQIGVKTVPVLWKGVIPQKPAIPNPNYCHTNDMISDKMVECDAGEYAKYIAEKYYDGPDPIGKTHIREGVVVRILNRPKFTAYKHKNHTFKVLSNIITESIADNADTSMSDDILSEL